MPIVKQRCNYFDLHDDKSAKHNCKCVREFNIQGREGIDAETGQHVHLFWGYYCGDPSGENEKGEDTYSCFSDPSLAANVVKKGDDLKVDCKCDTDTDKCEHKHCQIIWFCDECRKEM